MLKDWLVRRRENPYPSREEKKSLAQKTGLTYIQVNRSLSETFIDIIVLKKNLFLFFFFRFAIGLRIGDENLKMLARNHRRIHGEI